MANLSDIFLGMSIIFMALTIMSIMREIRKLHAKIALHELYFNNMRRDFLKIERYFLHRKILPREEVQ